jgi:FKBP-type peptidyl-prolyl cis-trans isomerase 2
MSNANNGDTVKVHYTGKLDDGSVFDSSVEREPLEFTLGNGQLIPGFENGVIGMKTGEKKSVTIPADEAYGPRKDDLVVRVGKDKVPGHITPEPGLDVQIKQPDGMVINMVVTEVTDSEVTFDANHPLAGQDLTFDIELVDISV